MMAPALKARLDAEMAVWRRKLAFECDADSAFRYEMFARRLQAAEAGCHERLEWAKQWAAQLQEEDLQQLHFLQENARSRLAVQANNRDLISRGISANPI
jgi:hypothetical protein